VINDRHGKKGLCDRIIEARLAGKNVTALLVEGEGYKSASAKTRRRWVKLAARK
jgi:hypothetical protein